MRAIAVIVVVAYHAGLKVPGGFVGVDVFFVISGYVITSMLQREWDATGKFNAGRFYLRRFKRLTPALALMVSSTMLVSVFLLSPLGPQQTSAKTGLAVMLLSANIAISQTTGGYFDAPAATNPLLNTWSLSVEEQFYLFFPLLLLIGWLLARRIRKLRQAPWILVGLVTMASFAAAYVGAIGWPPVSHFGFLFGFYSPVTRAWEFAVGAILAFATNKKSINSRTVAEIVGVLGIGLLLASLWLISDAVAFPGPWTLLPVFGSLFLILAGTYPNGLAIRALTSRSMVKLGDWSYSIYLWHWPLIVFAGLLWPGNQTVRLGAALFSIAPALLSYHFVEEPIRNMKTLTRIRLFKVVTAALIPPLVLAGAALGVANTVWAPKASTPMADALAKPPGYGLGCHFSGPATSTPGICHWHQNSSGVPVYLVGDSNAAHFTEGLIVATSKAGQPLEVSTASSCPLLRLNMTYPTANYGRVCKRYVDDTFNWLAKQPPGIVVLSETDEYWLSSSYGVVLSDGTVTTNKSRKISLMAGALAETIKTLKNSGQRVVLVQTLPHWIAPHAWNLSACTLKNTLSGCIQSMPLNFSQTRSKEVRSALIKVGQSTATPVVDLASAVCPGSICLTRRNGTWVYRDAAHISNAESALLADDFTRMIQVGIKWRLNQ